MAQVIIDPVCLVGPSTYHQKNVPSKLGASYGILYGLQKQLTYHICLTTPLGTSKQSGQELVKRMIEFDSLRMKKSKETVNYLDQFYLLGWYIMGTGQYIKNKQYSQHLTKQFSLRGGPYHLVLDSTGQNQPAFFRGNVEQKYSPALQQYQKICSDSMNFESNKNSALNKTLTKNERLLKIYNTKLGQILALLKSQQKISNEKKRLITQALSMYERLSLNTKHKQKTVEAINYTVLSGLILSKQKIKN